jgi:hypothetical protein
MAAARPRIPPALGLAVRVALVFVLLAWIGSRIHVDEFARTIRRSDPRWLVGAGLLLAAGQVLVAWRWHRLLRAVGSTWSFGRSFAVYCAGLFLGLFLPTGVGGDVYRVARVRTSGTGMARGTVTILLERAVGLVALLLLGTPFVLVAAGTRTWGPLFLAGAISGLGGLAMLWLPGGVEWAARLLDRVPGRKLGDRLRRAFPPEAMERLRGVMPGTVLLSLANHALILLVNGMLAQGLGVGIAWSKVAAAVPLVLLASQIPITPGGLGVREAGYVYFLGRVGMAEEPALAIALGWFALLLLVGLLAAIGFFADRGEKRAAGGGPPAAAS